MHLDHVTIKTSQPVETRDFFLAVFDQLVEKPRPRGIQRIPGHWLYAGEAPILHIIGGTDGGFSHGSEAWDHVGFRLTNYDGFLKSLDRLGIPFSRMNLPELNERRVFFRTPFGPLVEVVFHDD